MKSKMRAAISSFTMLLLALCVAFHGCKSKGDVFYEEGMKKFRAGDINGALNSYEAGLKVQPKNYHLLYATGWAWFSAGKNAEALNYFSRCVDAKNSYFGGHKGKGAVFAALGQWDKAKESYMKALERAPKNAAIYQNVADLYKSMGKAEDAKIAYNKAAALMPNEGDPLVGLMGLFFQQKSWTDAIATGEKALGKPFQQKNLKIETQRLMMLTYLERAKNFEQEAKTKEAQENRAKAKDFLNEARKETGDANLFAEEFAAAEAPQVLPTPS